MRRRYLKIIILFAAAVLINAEFSRAQNPVIKISPDNTPKKIRKTIDSLSGSLKNEKTDTTRVKVLIRIGDYFQNLKPDSAIYFHTKAQELALKIKNEYFTAFSIMQVGVDYNRLGNYDTSLLFFNRSLYIVEKSLLKKNRVNKFLRIKTALFINIGNIYEKFGNPDIALHYFFDALQLAENNGDKEKKAVCLGNIGIQYVSKGEFTKALNYLFDALKSNQNLSNKNGIARNLGNIGIAYKNMGDYSKAIEYYFKALQLAEELEDKNGIARHLGNIGTVYLNQNDYNKALEYYVKALKIFEEISHKDGIAKFRGNIGIVYKELHNYEKALQFSFEALKINEELSNEDGTAVNLGNLGNIFADKGDFENSLLYHLKALKINEEFGNKTGIATNLGNIGSVLTEIGKFSEAEKYLKNALMESSRIKALQLVSTHHRMLSHLYDTTGRYRPALEHYKKHIVARDSIANENNAKKQIQSQMQYDFDKKSAADSIKNSEAKKFEEIKHQQEISKQKTFTYGGIAGFLVMIIVAGISYNAFRNKKKANVMIAQQKALVEEKQKEILDSIHYAKRIQTALLTGEKYIGRKLNELRK